MKRFLVIAILFIGLVSSGLSQSNGKKAVAAQKALFFYSFATQIDWPQEYKSGNFVIGIYGDHELYTQLVSRLSSSKRGNQPFKIVEYKSASEIKECHILYVDESKSAVLATMKKTLRATSTLVITDKSGLLGGGAMINFVYPNNRTMFELSKSNAEKSKLVIGKQISSLAVEVQ